MSEAVAAGVARLALSAAATARLIALLLPLALLGGALRLAISRRALPVRDVLVAALGRTWRAIVLAALAFTAPAASSRSRSLTLLAALAIAVSGAIGVYHAGVEAKIFEGFTQCTATRARGVSTADLLKQITHAPLVRCDEVQWSASSASRWPDGTRSCRSAARR